MSDVRKGKTTQLGILLILGVIVVGLLYVIATRPFHEEPRSLLSCPSFSSYEDVVETFCREGRSLRLDRDGDGIPCEDERPVDWIPGPVSCPVPVLSLFPYL